MFLKNRVIERAQKKALPTVRGLWRLLWYVEVEVKSTHRILPCVLGFGLVCMVSTKPSNVRQML